MFVDGSPALNRVSWTPNGQQITVGDDMGKVWIYDVGEVSKANFVRVENQLLIGINVELEIFEF